MHHLLLSTFIFRLWIWMMRPLASSEGCGSSILRSSRPDRSSAGSKTSGLFVAAITCSRRTQRQRPETRAACGAGLFN